MTLLLLIWLFFSPLSGTENLLDNIEFNEYGIGYKTDILVKYIDIGKTNNIASIQSCQKGFESTTSLSFIYGDNEYYIPIEDKQIPNFISTIDEGTFLLIDIVVLDKTICQPSGRTKNIYCAYISNIRMLVKHN